MLFSTSLIALVGAGEQAAYSPRRLQITNTKRDTSVCEFTFTTSILAVKLNRRRLIVMLEEQIYVYDISNMKLLHTIETSPNPDAVMAFAPSSENCFLLYPSPTPASSSPFSASPPVPSNTIGMGRSRSTNTGDVLVFDALNLQVLNIVQAHKSPVAYIAINNDGTMMATASEKGTVVRVHSLPDAQKLYQFRRGSYSAHVYCITFNLVSTLLCVSSDQETVHIFRLMRDSADRTGFEPEFGFDGTVAEKRTSREMGGIIGRAIKKNVAGYLPDMLTEIWEPSRDFASLKLKSTRPKVRSIVAVNSNAPEVFVVTEDGYFYLFNIDLENGGECTQVKQYSLLEQDENAVKTLIAD